MKIQTLTVGALGTNCYIVSDEQGRTAVIDPGAEESRILAAVAGVPVEAILLTHAHFDHIGAVEAVRCATGAPVLVCAADEPLLEASQRNLSARFCPETPLSVKADRLLREGDTVSVGTLTFTVLETPGHTPGSVCFAGDGVLFSGDTLFAGGAGRTDFPDGSPTALKISLHRLAALTENARVYPGHGCATSLEDEKNTNPWLV